MRLSTYSGHIFSGNLTTPKPHINEIPGFGGMIHFHRECFRISSSHKISEVVAVTTNSGIPIEEDKDIVLDIRIIISG